VERHAVAADLRGFADDHARLVIDKEPKRSNRPKTAIDLDHEFDRGSWCSCSKT
jgi:hypothetical protein